MPIWLRLFNLRVVSPLAQAGRNKLSLNLPCVQDRATRVARTLLRPGSEGTGGLSQQSSCFVKLALTNGPGEYASCRFAAWTYNVQATRGCLSAGVPRFELLQGF